MACASKQCSEQVEDCTKMEEDLVINHENKKNRTATLAWYVTAGRNKPVLNLPIPIEYQQRALERYRIRFITSPENFGQLVGLRFHDWPCQAYSYNVSTGITEESALWTRMVSTHGGGAQAEIPSSDWQHASGTILQAQSRISITGGMFGQGAVVYPPLDAIDGFRVLIAFDIEFS